MAGSFYNHWNPVRHGYSPQTRPFSKPKVVNIPVNFVYSEDASRKKPSTPTAVSPAADRKAAAVSIQKAVRGFLVRMNVRVVRQIAMEVDEIERKVREEEVKIRMDIKERLRVSEELMALLLRLDSVRWVRDLRKKMIRRVMGLQEVIDSIPAAADADGSTIDMSENPEGVAGESGEESSIHQTMDLDETNDPGIELEIEIPPAAESPSPTGKIDLTVAADGGIPTSVVTEDHEESTSESMKSSSVDNLNAIDQLHDPEVGIEMENQAAVESPKRKSDLVNMEIAEEEIGSLDAVVSKAGEPSEGVSGLKEIMERMAVENETLKMMVTRLCETSAEQCRLMESLAGRVNNLERAVHRMDRRKKSKRGATRP